MVTKSLVALTTIVTLGVGVPAVLAEGAPLPLTGIGGWGASLTSSGPSFTDQTIREVVHPTTGGAGVRLRLSNWQSATALAVGEVDVAVRASGAAELPGSRRLVTFSGARTPTISAGQDLTSDVIPLWLTTGEDLLVSIYLPGPTGPSTWHSRAIDTSYLSTAGNHAAQLAGADYPSTTTSWYYLAGLDIVAPTSAGAVVTFGDSITDGYGSASGADHRWPNYLAARLNQGPGQHLSVVDAGLSGNRVLTDADASLALLGISGERRFAHDALAVPGVRDVILLEGINDIGALAGPNGSVLTAQDLIDGYRNLIAQAHQAHVRIIGGTITPFQGSPYYYSAAGEAIRETVNNWIRTSGAFDGVIDFDAALRDPANPLTMNPAFDSGDHLHPNDMGAAALANAVNLTLLHCR